ncbi:MAG: LysE family translocator [Streptosporangiales bacterium]|nr:LysE family translocator [Streptosporangiales bacterium]
MSALLSVVPGPSVLFVVGRALAHGRATAVYSVLGNALGGYLLVIAVACGLGAIVTQSVAVFTAIKLAGAAYLVYLGVSAMLAARRRGPTAPMDAGEPAGVLHGGRVRRLWEGLTVGVTNPKSIVFLVAMLPQFIDREAGHVVLQMLIIGLVGALIQAGTDGVWAMTAAAARSWFARSPRRMQAMQVSGGAAMVGLGVKVAVSGRPD